MDRHDDPEVTRDLDTTTGGGETHASTGGAAAAGAVTGGVIGLTGGPLGAAIGAVGGAIVGVAAERMMHSDDDADRARNDDLLSDRQVDSRTAGTDVQAATTSDITAASSTPVVAREAVFDDRDDETER